VLVPKLVTTLQSYTREQFVRDLTAGVIVGIVALPLAIAFAIASGVTPEKGLYTAIIAGFIISALGGSRVQIGGPTGAFIVIVYGIVQQHGVDGLTIATVMAGLILIVLGVARMGAAIKFIPHPVTIGFTSGIAVIIFSSQVKDYLGLEMGDIPAHFLDKWRAFWAASSTTNWPALGIAALATAIIVAWPRVSRRIPGPLVALLATTALAHVLGLDVETIGSRFGDISASLPAPSLPRVSFDVVVALVPAAFAIALLGGIESLLSAVVADGMIGSRHRSNMELVAQGVANVVTPFFGGIPATGAIARTATNVKNGGRTPVAGMIHAVTLLLITLFVGRWAALIPMAALAAILVIVAYHMSEWRSFASEVRGAPRSDVVVLLVTFGLTVLVDLVVAIEVGMVLAAFLFMRRMAEVTNVSVVARELQDGDEDEADPYALKRREVPAGVVVYEIDGPFFFGAAEKFRETLGQVATRPKVLIIRLRKVPAMDSTGIHALRQVIRRATHDGVLVLLSGVHAQPLVVLERAGVLDDLGPGAVFADVDEALDRARAHLGLPLVTRLVPAPVTSPRETPIEGIPRYKIDR
jgi:sulfate permease, SulP family